VGTLAEFLPSDPALLGNNMNAGERINLRLRPPGNTSAFYEYDQLVLVMLHELTHIEFGPHDTSFYKLLAELEDEFYELKRKGYSGEGFHGAGNHLSGFKVSEHVGKAKGLVAAQQRLDTQRMIWKGGKLGGSDVRGRSMKEVMAEAAERRMRDDRACHPQDSGHAREIEEEVRKAQQESIGIDAIELDSDSSAEAITPPTVEQDIINIRTPSPDLPQITGVSDVLKPTSVAVETSQRESAAAHSKSSTLADPSSKLINTRSVDVVKPRTRTKDVKAPATSWSCPTCTLINPISTATCDACSSPRPKRQGAGSTWFCEFCGTGPREMEFWSCADCGWVRNWG